MYKIIIKSIICIILLLPGIMLAQQGIGFTYDASGNRVLREVITLPNKDAVVANNEIYNTDNKNNQEEKFQSSLDDFTIQIFPNPTKGHLKVEISESDNNVQGVIGIYTLNGTELLMNPNITESVSLDLSNYPSGSYIMKVVINNSSKEWIVVKQ
ncbi:T9SS type A sorting domain-containing protein [Bacteroidota bacterium]